MINMALPTGRLSTLAYSLFIECGLVGGELDDSSRKLVVEDPEAGLRFLLVKPTDVAIYVERGAADFGVVGSDTLLESEADVYELLDLGIGRCRIAVAAERGWSDDLSIPLRVATKYPYLTQKYYNSKSRRIEIIKLNGSIELAPLMGLSDVIVDIVETGKTLADNNLSIVTVIAHCSARLIANKSSYRFHSERIDEICGKLANAATQTRGDL